MNLQNDRGAIPHVDAGTRPAAGPVRIAVLGLGFARSVILPCLRHVSGARVVGIAGRDVGRLQATAADFGVEAIATDHREILERARPDLVVVATPPHRHAEMALDALAHGSHVLCEKPMALDAGETTRMAEAARALPDRLALVDHELRFLPVRVRLGEMIATGRLGRVLRAEYRLHAPLRRDPAQPWNWWSDRACGGGIWGAIGSHALDALRNLLGEVVEVQGRLATMTTERRDPASGALRPVTADDVAEAWLRFASGAVGTVVLSTVEAERVHRLTVSGTEGWARLDEQGPLRFALGREPVRTETLPDGLPPSSELGIPDTDWARAFLLLARRIVAAIRDGGGVFEAASFDDGHRVQQVLDAVRLSAEDGRRVRLDAG
jgi:predicted dehydrogenase